MADPQAPPAPPLEPVAPPSTTPELNDSVADAAALTPPKAEEAAPAKMPAVRRQLLHVPSTVGRYASKTDQTLSRLNKLLTTTGGLDSFLSTINYSLYLLAYLHARSPSSSAISLLLSRLLRLRPSFSSSPKGRVSVRGPVLPPPPPPSTPGLPSPFNGLGSLISETRTTLRLTALLPLYSWLRSLVSPNQKREDPWLRGIAIAQCISYIIYQALENVAYLSDRGIIPKRWLERTGGSARWWMWSNRAWLAGVSCDFARLARQALLEKWRKTAIRRGDGTVEKDNAESVAKTSRIPEEEEAAAERKWWSELFVAGCWFPLCVHWSLESGLKGFNDGSIGLLGLMAGAESFRTAWTATATLDT